MKNYFYNSNENQILGTATPQYMMYPYIFEEIKKELSNIKLIIILRNPIDRLLSHIDMTQDSGGKKET